jgi:hypothetical protein
LLGVLLIPLDFVPGTLEARGALDPRLFELGILTCEALVSFAVAVAGRPLMN